MAIVKKELQRFLEGHVRAGAVIAHERRQRLQSLTEEQARREYESLCQIWQPNRSPESMASLDESRALLLQVRRKRLNLLGRGKPKA